MMSIPFHILADLARLKALGPEGIEELAAQMEDDFADFRTLFFKASCNSESRLIQALRALLEESQKYPSNVLSGFVIGIALGKSCAQIIIRAHLSFQRQHSTNVDISDLLARLKAHFDHCCECQDSRQSNLVLSMVRLQDISINIGMDMPTEQIIQIILLELEESGFTWN